MACDKKTIYPIGESWEDKFGGEIWFKSLPESCDRRNPTAEVRVKTPWGSSEYVYVEDDDHFIKTYTSGDKIYSVDIFLFCGMEITKLQAETCYEIDKCKNVTCADVCAPDGTLTVKKCDPSTGDCITDHTEPLSNECTGSIRCQAYDSVSKNALEAKILLDNTDISQVTPFIITKVTPGQHDITYILDGYTKVSNRLIVTKKVQSESNVSMIQLDVPGFDINVNIPGLLPNSQLFVFEVSKIPLTDTWWDSPFGAGIRWDNITNSTYNARELKENCTPAPDFFAGLRKDQDYVIYVGTSAISLYPGTLVHKLTNTTTTINITDSYVDWVSTELCSAFDISPQQCPNFIITSVSDAAFLLEQWKIITEHKNLAGEETLPTALDYALIPIAVFGMFSPGLSEGKITELVGKRITNLIEIVKKGPDNIKSVPVDEMFDTFIMRASDSQFDDLVRYLEGGFDINAKTLLHEVDNIPLSKDELSALHRASSIIEQIDNDLIRASSKEKIHVILTNFSDKFKKVYHRALDWTRDNPKQALGIGILAIWFMVDNIPFYIYMYLKATGSSPGDKSWQGKGYVDVIDQYKFNVIEAEKISDWDLFCTNLDLWETEVDALEKHIIENKSTLENETTYDIYVGIVEVYREAIKIKKEVYTCVPMALPESFDAEVIEILDGDTVKIEYLGKEYDVRFLGINTPEKKTYTYTCTEVKEPFLIRRLLTPGKECIEEETWHANEEFFVSTKKWIGNMLPIHQIATFISDQDDQFDDYGRLLAIPYRNDKNICIESLKSGQSVVFFYDNNKWVSQEDFLYAENVAKKANIGVWSFLQETGWIKFISTPTAAEVYLDGVNIGKTVSNTLLVETSLGYHDYEFKKVGYLGCVGHILEVNKTHTENNPYEKTCTLELEEPPCPNPNASFVISPTSPDVNETITFDASASTAGGNESMDSYTWNFGDGTDGSGRVTTHSYVSAGSYVAKLTVRNDCRETDVSIKTISVKGIIDTGDITVKTYSKPGTTLSGVTVYVDNIDKGNAPVTIKNLSVGQHTVRLEKTGYLGCSYCLGTDCQPDTEISPCDFSVNVIKDITRVLEVTMNKLHEIEILSIPEGANILVDGKPITTSLNMIEMILAGKK